MAATNSNSDQQSGIMTVNAQDLKDPQATKLNNVIQFLASRIALMEPALSSTQSQLAAAQATISSLQSKLATPAPAGKKAATASSGTTNTNGSTSTGGGVPVTGGGVPTVNVPQVNIPVVTALPGPLDPLSVIGQYVIYAGQPYVFTAGLTGPPGFWAISLSTNVQIRDTFANLSLYPATNYPVGTLFYATDWTVTYAVQMPAGVPTWLYYNGIYGAPIANVPGTLGVNDRGFIFHATDYLHNWEWNGSAWNLTTGGIFPTSIYYNVGSPPFGGTGALWHACDGSIQPVSQNDATLVSMVLPNIANGWFVL